MGTREFIDRIPDIILGKLLIEVANQPTQILQREALRIGLRKLVLNRSKVYLSDEELFPFVDSLIKEKIQSLRPLGEN